jgi:phospholipid transport system substrate-binding protein
MSKTHLIRFALVGAVSTVLAGAAFAQASDPAAARIESFDAALIKTLQAGKSAGVQGRAKVIGPAVEQSFDLGSMVRFAVGPDWNKMSPDDQAALQKSFSRFTIANYAKNFDNYDGQKLVLDGPVQTRGVDKLVKTKLTGSGSDVALAYRMRDNGSGWKIIDVYTGSISQLTTRRSDFAASLSSGGAQGLISHLNTLVANQMK